MSISPRFIRTSILGASSLVVAISGTATAGDIPLLKPASELSFATPSELPNPSFEVQFGALCSSLSTAAVSGTSVTAFTPLGRGHCETRRINHFAFDGEFFDSTVPVRICGRASLNGFLALVGMGQASVDVVVELSDLGADLLLDTDDRLIHSETILNRHAVNELSPTLAGEIGVDIGSATVLQGGVAASIGVNIPLHSEVVRESIDFGFDVPLRRGHTYSLTIYERSQVKLGPAGGLAIASFLSIDNVPKNLLNPAIWLANSNLPFADLALPNITFSQTGLTKLFDFPAVITPADFPVLGAVTLIPPLSIAVPAPPFPSTNELLANLGIPTDIAAMAGSALLGFGSNFLAEEGVLDAGLRVPALAAIAADDPKEDAVRRDIERNLARDNFSSPVISFQLPKANGGYLEFARSMVTSTTQALAVLGEDMSKAEKYLVLADKKYAAGKYKDCYEALRKAYQRAGN